MTASGSEQKKAKARSKRTAEKTEAKDESKKASAPEEDDEPEEGAPKARKAATERGQEVDESLEPFLEGDHETRMTFDHGGFPLYVKAAWAIFLVSVTYYMYVYALPDLTAWGSP